MDSIEEIDVKERKKLKKSEWRPVPVEALLNAKHCHHPNMARLLEDPVYREIAEKTLRDPAYIEIQRQLRYQRVAPSKFDAEAYSAAVQQVVNNPELMANAKRFKTALSKNPSMPKSYALIKDAIESIASEDETGTGLTAARLMKMSDRNAFLKSYKAFKLERKGDDTMPFDKSSLHHMAMSGDAEALKNALDSGADVNKLDLVKGTALHVACAYGKVECAKILIKYEVDVNAVDNDENTALHYAAGYGMANCVELLLKSGANKEVRNRKGYTPIGVAPLRNDSNVLKLLE